MTKLITLKGYFHHLICQISNISLYSKLFDIVFNINIYHNKMLTFVMNFNSLHKVQ